jgi:sugar/nucleoside kinase (ribokinase family)
VQNSDITLVGHFAIDSIRLPSLSSPFIVLGGPVTYASFVARRLDATTSVISKVGGDFPEAYRRLLMEEGIDLSSVIKQSDEQTTRFEIGYSRDLSNRTLKLTNKAPPIKVSDLPRALHTKAVHIAPIASEISYKVIKRLRKCTKILSLDPQGLLRSFDKTGNVKTVSPVNKCLFSLIDIYRSSLEEIRAVTGHSHINSAIKAVHDFGIEIVIVTLGAKGAVLSSTGTLYSIPACNSRIFVDPTGAGDAFIGGFLSEYIRQKDTVWCACVGSAAASMVGEGIGPTFLGEKEEIYQRASTVYQKEIKQ